MKKVVVVYHSGYGHTKVQAEHVVKGVQENKNVSVTLLTSEEALKDLTPLNEADGIIFGCPTYMGGPSAQFKTFIDGASKVWFHQGWKNKIAAGFTNSKSPSGDKLNTLQSLFINAMQHSMIWVGLGEMNGATTAGDTESINRLGGFSGAMSQSIQESSSPVEADLRTAERLGKRVADVVCAYERIAA